MFKDSPVKVIFVDDGPRKYDRRGHQAPVLRNDVSALSVIRDNGIDVVQAPEEAIAYCALLQKKQKIDIVLTTDSDAFFFDATTVVRLEQHYAVLCLDGT